MNRAAVTQDLVNRAGKWGLSAAETQRLAEVLRQSDDFAADSRLVADLLDTNNPDRGLRTFCELDSLRRQHPDRINPEIVRTLSIGVAKPERAAQVKIMKVFSAAMPLTGPRRRWSP